MRYYHQRHAKKHLVGCTIIDVKITEFEGDSIGDGMPTLVLKKPDGFEFEAYIQRDSEGNGPGALMTNADADGNILFIINE